LNNDRKVVVEKQKLPAPDTRASYAIGSEAPERAIRHAAMNALISVRGQEERTFKSLARFVRDDSDRHAAILALQRIPTAHWPKEEAKPLVESLLAYIRTVPTQERTRLEVLDAMQLGDALATL